MSEAETDWKEVARTLVARWRAVVAITVAGGIAATAYAFLAPSWYEADISVVPGTPAKGIGAAGALGALAADLPLDLNVGGSDAERIQAVLSSRSMTDAVIDRFHLIDRYDETYREDARKDLWHHCSSRLDKRPGVVTIKCEDKDPRIAQQMAEYFGEYGNDIFRRVSASSAHEERTFLEQRVAETKKAVDDASEKLREFEETNKLIDLPEQSKAVVSAIASLNGELLSKELQLSYLTTFSSADEATAVQTRQQIAVMQRKLKALEETAPVGTKPVSDLHKQPSDDRGMFPAALSVPKLRFELTQLYREQKTQEALYLLLTQRYEMAKVNEARDTSTFQIVDHAVVPTKRARPKRTLIIVAASLLGLLMGCAWVVRASLVHRMVSSSSQMPGGEEKRRSA